MISETEGVVFVPSCSYLDNVWDKFSVWFYLLLLLGFMYAYPIYKSIVYVLPRSFFSIVPEGWKMILHFSCPTVVPPDQEYIQEEM